MQRPQQPCSALRRLVPHCFFKRCSKHALQILIAALQGDVSTASEIKQGNTCINVLDLSPGGDCVVRALDVREHLLREALDMALV